MRTIMFPDRYQEEEIVESKLWEGRSTEMKKITEGIRIDCL